MLALFKGIGWRIFFSFSTLLIGLTLVFSFVALKFVQKTSVDNAANELRVLSVTLSEQLRRYTRRVETGAKSLSAGGGVIDLELKKEKLNTRRLTSFLQTKLLQLPVFDSLSVFNTTGLCIASTDPDWRGLPGQREAFFINGLRHFSFAEIFQNLDQERILLVSTPINEGSDPHGVLVGVVKLSFIYDLMGQQLGLKGTEAFLLDSRLRFITPGKSGPDELLESHLASTPLVQHLQDEFWVGQYSNYRGIQVLGTVTRPADGRWYLVIERDFSEVEAQVSQVKEALFGSTLGLLFVLIIVTIILTTSITRPLQKLMEGARRIASGDLSLPILIPQTNDEISFLAAEFDRMRARVAASQGRLIEQLEESEQRRLESQRLAAIGTLASSLAHEIRNPLNAISLLLAQMERSRGSDEARAKMFDEMKSELGRLDRLVSDILDYARPVSLQKEAINLQVFLQSLTDFYKAILDERKIHLVLALPKGEIQIEGDRDKLRQAFVNLIKNAIEAMPNGGQIEITLEVLDRGVRCILKDNGVGIDPKTKTRLYDLFFTTKEQGTGLGLSTVKKIIDAHGGKIDINSAPGRGTSIVIILPK